MAGGNAAKLPVLPAKHLLGVGLWRDAHEAFLSNYHGSRCLDPGTAGPGSGRDCENIEKPFVFLGFLRGAWNPLNPISPKPFVFLGKMK